MEHTIAQIPNESSEVKLTVTLVLNASFSWSEKPGKNLLTYYLMACIILASLALTAIVLNVCLLLAIFSSSNLKRLTLNQLASIVSFTCLTDCFLNVPFSLYYMKIRTGTLGIRMCTMNAIFVLSVSLIITWGVCGMCFERLISTWKRNKDKSTVFCKHSVAIGTPLLAAVAVLLPVILGLIEVRVFPNRLSCFIANDKEQQYRTIILLCYISPMCLGLMALLSSLTINFRNIKNISMQRVDLSYAELFFEESHLWIEWQNTKFVGCIAILYSVLEIPFIFKETECVSPSNRLSELTHQNTTVGGFLAEIQLTPPGDRAYSWIKFSFCLLFPLSTLLLRKDIRRKLMSMISFCRTNASITKKRSNAESGVPQQECPDDFLVPQGWRRRRRLSSVTSLTTPIVFGRPKVGSAQFQLLDISTGIARWKDNYSELKNDTQNGRTFFDHAFEDDEDEFTEFVSYEDGTEEEINSSEQFQSVTTFKEVGIQTSDSRCFSNETTSQIISHANVANVDTTEIVVSSEKRKLRVPNRPQSKSFTANRTNITVSRQRNYLTYPKLSPSSKYLYQLKSNPSTSDLLKALKAYRSKKLLTACDILPRGTGELMDTSLEARDVVSL